MHEGLINMFAMQSCSRFKQKQQMVIVPLNKHLFPYNQENKLSEMQVDRQVYFLRKEQLLSFEKWWEKAQERKN